MENVARSCQFQFLDPPIVASLSFRPPQYHPPHPPVPCIRTHIPQCLSCNFRQPTPPTHATPLATPHGPPTTQLPPHPPHILMHPYTYPSMFVILPVSVFRPPNCCQLKILDSPGNIVKGNGVMFENFTININFFRGGV